MDSDQFGPRRERVVVEQSRRGGKPWLWLLIILLLVATGVGAYFFMNRNTATTADTDTTESTSTVPTEEPMPTEEEVDLAEYKIEVLNGTSIAGEAGKLKTSLESAGFTVDSTANADKTTYTKTIVQAKENVKAGFITKLKSELEGTFTLGSDETLDEDDDHDVVVIIGKEDTGDDKEASDEADTEDTEDETLTPTPTKSE